MVFNDVIAKTGMTIDAAGVVVIVTGDPDAGQPGQMRGS